MTKKTITLSIEFSPADYASLKAFTDCKPDWSIDEVLSKALSEFLQTKSKEKTEAEMVRDESNNKKIYILLD